MMKKQTAIQSAAGTLGLAGLFHLVRVIAGWDIMIADWALPVWLSIVLVLWAWCVAWHLWKIKK